jgi:hypothetical protein
MMKTRKEWIAKLAALVARATPETREDEDGSFTDECNDTVWACPHPDVRKRAAAAFKARGFTVWSSPGAWEDAAELKAAGVPA